MVDCMAAPSCPRYKNRDPYNRELSLNVDSTLITYSVTNHAFCNHCSKARRLLNWGHEHQYPAIRAHCAGLGYVAIGVGQWNWISSVLGSRREVIDAYFAEAIGDDTPEEIGDVQKIVTASKPRWQPRRSRR